jgi:hypothetical protein
VEETEGELHSSTVLFDPTVNEEKQQQHPATMRKEEALME